MHHFLMISAVVVHDHQKRDFMMCRGPEHSGGVHQIAVALDGHGNDPFVAISESRAHRRWRAVSDARATRTAEEVVILSRREQVSIPLHTRDGHTPFLVLNRVPKRRGNPRGAYGRRIPAGGGHRAYSFFHPAIVRA